MSKKSENLITQTEAAELRGMSLAAVNEHVRNGRWRSELKYGKRLVHRDDVVGFDPKTHKAKHRVKHQTKNSRRGQTSKTKKGRKSEK